MPMFLVPLSIMLRLRRLVITITTTITIQADTIQTEIKRKRGWRHSSDWIQARTAVRVHITAQVRIHTVQAHIHTVQAHIHTVRIRTLIARDHTLTALIRTPIIPTIPQISFQK